MTVTPELRAPRAQPRPETEQRAAFRALHGPRLQGFALIITLGDHPLAAQLAWEALVEGVSLGSLYRSPGRAPAWLRAKVLRDARKAGERIDGPEEAERRRVLDHLGVEGPAYDALAALSMRDRAAIAAALIEKVDAVETAAMLRTSPAKARRAMLRARDHYVVAFSRAFSSWPRQGGNRQLAERVRAIAEAAQ